MNIRSPEYTITVKHTVSTNSGGGKKKEKARDYSLCASGKAATPAAASRFFQQGILFYSRSILVNTKPRTSDLLVPAGWGGVMHGEASGRENTDGYRRGREPAARSAPGEAEV